MEHRVAADGWINACGQILVCAAVTLLGLSSAWAHKVNVYAYVESERVVVQGYFGGKAKAVDCVVEVLGPDGKKITEGKTDARGVCAFPVADLTRFQGNLRIVLHAGAVHKAEFTLAASELAGGNRISRPASEPSVETKENPKSINRGESNPVMDRGALTKVLEETLDRKIRPLSEMVSNQQRLLLEQKDKGPGLIEIIGGIGWIFGIFGVAAYFASRRRGDRNSR